jgi:hypothetical protein
VLIALGLALLLNRPRRGVGLYRASVYVPTLVPSVAYALVWLWIFNPRYGPLDLALAGLGLPTPAWLVDRATALPALALTALFQIGDLRAENRTPDEDRSQAQPLEHRDFAQRLPPMQEAGATFVAQTSSNISARKHPANGLDERPTTHRRQFSRTPAMDDPTS